MKLSVIIPTYNEASCIEKTLQDLLKNHNPDEVIVVDGGSQDGTVEIVNNTFKDCRALLRSARNDTFLIIPSGKGRAVQMNAGANQAAGDILFFLHADTRLPIGGLLEIKKAVQSGNFAGRFRMKFDSPKWILKLYSTYTRFQIFSYGDQGLFIQKSLFQEMGGFDEGVPFEDLEFYRRLRDRVRPLILKSRVVTSARRFLQMGCLKQKFINIFLVGLYYLRIDILPKKEHLYPDIR